MLLRWSSNDAQLKLSKTQWTSFGEKKLGQKRASAVMNHIMPKISIFGLQLYHRHCSLASAHLA